MSSMMKFSLFSGLLLLVTTVACGQPEVSDNPAKAGPDFAVQGEYEGAVQTDSGEVKYGLQVIARGEGNFHAVAYRGGLPGAGWDKSDAMQADGKLSGGAVRFEAPDHNVSAVLKDGAVALTDGSGNAIGQLKKVTRKSPTLGAKPPKGAVVLFDGKNADEFRDGRMTKDGLLMEGATSKKKFGSGTIHVEFRTPFMPKAEGQGRGNSGCYIQGCYELQILDSFGLEGLDNECGGIYQIAKPSVNMCLPPLSWQTYDIDLTAAKFEDGKKVQNARVTIRHNGVVIHDNLELPRATPGGVAEENAEGGPLFFQNHGNPVRFQNIWFAPKE